MKRFLVGLVGILLLYFLIAVLLSIIPTNPKSHECTIKQEIYISTNGIHLEIIVPKETIPIPVQQDLQIRNTCQYIGLAWGDRGFYLDTPTWADLTFGTACKALLINSPSAMHVFEYPKKYDDWQILFICPKQLKQLLKFVMPYFKLSENGEVIEIENTGYTSFDRFYEANGKYNCFLTCNQWVNNALKEADIKTSVWSPFDEGVLFHIKNL